MGLEAATYIANLDVGNPLAGDRKSQGDDHLRLIKTVLQNTFPNGNAPFYRPAALFAGGSTVLANTDENKFCFITPGVGVTVTLPPGPTEASNIIILKNGLSSDPVFVVPAAGSITTAPAGGPQTIAKARCDVPYESYMFTYLGGGWILSYPGPRPGSIQLHMGALPLGYGIATGQSLLRADFPELFNSWGTLWGAVDGTHFNAPDLRDRFPVFSGGAYALGAVGGETTHALTIAELPVHSHGITQNPHTHTVHSGTTGGAAPVTGSDALGGNSPVFNGGQVTIDAANADITINNTGGGAIHENRPPYFGMMPIFRFC